MDYKIIFSYLFFLFCVIIFGVSYGTVVNTSGDAANNIKNAMYIIMPITMVLIAVFALLSSVYITSPGDFQQYIIFILNFTLLLSLLTVSISVLKISS